MSTGKSASKYQAPDSWQLWHHPNPESDGWECLLYSDARLRAPDGPHTVGPFEFWPTFVEPPPGVAAPRLVLRIPRAQPVLEWQEDGRKAGPSRDLLKRNSHWWLGTSVDDEVAALLSLALGVRLRSGGLVRRFVNGGDAAGVPELHDHHAPTLAVPSHHRIMLPQLRNTHVRLAPGFERLRSLKFLSPTTAVELTKAAHEYASAVWIADEDAQSAWLHLVTAIEVVAVHTQVHKTNHVDLFAEAHPRVVEQLKSEGGLGALPFIADQFAHLLIAGERFQRFAARYAPPAPQDRPQRENWRIDWDNLRPALKTIYGYRSNLLHAGKPFPPMMVLGHPERDSNEAPAECPDSDTFFASGTAGWEPGKAPMYLWTFAYLVRGALLKWWQEQVNTQST